LARGRTDTWHNGADIELHLYARSLQRAAKLLVERLKRTNDAKTAWDVGPVVLLYQQAAELRMKALIGEGGGFLPSPTDHITLYKTHSLRWLAQIVCQVIKAVGWESEFRCEGISSFGEFRALVNQLAALEPVSAAIHSPKRGRLGEVPESLQKAKVLELAWKLDALLDLLDATADALAATWDQQAGFPSGHILRPTIQ
jgi:hypothetical protein